MTLAHLMLLFLFVLQNVRQHALTLLTDMVLDRHGTCIPLLSLCEIMNSICIPIAGERITDLLRIPRNADVDLEEIMIELELCISLLFKPFLHHLKNLVSLEQEFLGIWISMLGIMTHLLGDDEAPMEEDDYDDGIMTREKLFRLTQELGSEHLRNAVMVLIAMNVLVNEDDDEAEPSQISSATWAAIGSIGYCRPLIDEWKGTAQC